MATVVCFCDNCKWCNDEGRCSRNVVTIDFAGECDSYEDYSKDYTDPFYKAVYDDNKNPCRTLCYGKKIEYNGYVFYTEDKINKTGNYYLTEARTGVGAGPYCMLEDRWELFLERVNTYPDIMTLPLKESDDEE